MWRLLRGLIGMLIGSGIMIGSAQAAERPSMSALPRFEQATNGWWFDRSKPSVEHPGQYLIVAKANGQAIGRYGQWLIRGRRVSASVWQDAMAATSTPSVTVKANQPGSQPRPLASKKRRASKIESSASATNDPSATNPATSGQEPLTDDRLQNNSSSTSENPATNPSTAAPAVAEAPASADAATPAASDKSMAKLPQTGEYHGILRVWGLILLTVSTCWWWVKRRYSAIRQS